MACLITVWCMVQVSTVCGNYSMNVLLNSHPTWTEVTALLYLHQIHEQTVTTTLQYPNKHAYLFIRVHSEYFTGFTWHFTEYYFSLYDVSCTVIGVLKKESCSCLPKMHTDLNGTRGSLWDRKLNDTRLMQQPKPAPTSSEALVYRKMSYSQWVLTVSHRPQVSVLLLAALLASGWGSWHLLSCIVTRRDNILVASVVFTSWACVCVIMAICGPGDNSCCGDYHRSHFEDFARCFCACIIDPSLSTAPLWWSDKLAK